MLPQEVAELTLELMQATEETNNFDIESIELAEISGHGAYRADVRFGDEQGLAKRLRICGTIIDGYVCEFAYEAADEAYFERYLPAFERLVTSVSRS